jgi:trk system potassium uptake protein
LEGLRRIVANMGFLLQVTGLLLVLPVAIGLQLGELQSVASIIATCFICFGFGFAFNALAERKELDEKTSIWLMLLSFIIIPLILMVPYIWNNVFGSTNILDLFSNAYFETISGFTTTGFSFIENPQMLSSSLLFYRSLIEFIGGIGFIYILIAFLYPKGEIDSFLSSFGIEAFGNSMKKLLALIMMVYTVIAIIFTAIFYFSYSPNLIFASTAAIDVLTGGYDSGIAAGIGFFHISVIILMIIGGLNFKFHYNLFHLKLRELFTPEIKLYLLIILSSTVVISILAWVDPFVSLFHSASFVSSTGIAYLDLATVSVPTKIWLIIIMLIGGCGFSMAGGIKIERVKKLVNAIRRNDDAPTKHELRSIILYIVAFVVLLLILSLAFSTSGTNMLDSVFEVGSALSTAGASVGATTVTMPVAYKWILIVAMLIGRVEIVSIYKAIVGFRKNSIRDTN